MFVDNNRNGLLQKTVMQSCLCLSNIPPTNEMLKRYHTLLSTVCTNTTYYIVPAQV